MDKKLLSQFAKQKIRIFKITSRSISFFSDQETILINFPLNLSSEMSSLSLIEKLKIVKEVVTPVINNLIEENQAESLENNPNQNYLSMSNLIIFLNKLVNSLIENIEVISKKESENLYKFQKKEFSNNEADDILDSMELELVKIKIVDCLNLCLNDLSLIKSDLENRKKNILKINSCQTENFLSNHDQGNLSNTFIQEKDACKNPVAKHHTNVKIKANTQNILIFHDYADKRLEKEDQINENEIKLEGIFRNQPLRLSEPKLSSMFIGPQKNTSKTSSLLPKKNCRNKCRKKRIERNLKGPVKNLELFFDPNVDIHLNIKILRPPSNNSIKLQSSNNNPPNDLTQDQMVNRFQISPDIVFPLDNSTKEKLRNNTKKFNFSLNNKKNILIKKSASEHMQKTDTSAFSYHFPYNIYNFVSSLKKRPLLYDKGSQTFQTEFPNTSSSSTSESTNISVSEERNQKEISVSSESIGESDEGNKKNTKTHTSSSENTSYEENRGSKKHKKAKYIFSSSSSQSDEIIPIHHRYYKISKKNSRPKYYFYKELYYPRRRVYIKKHPREIYHTPAYYGPNEHFKYRKTRDHLRSTRGEKLAWYQKCFSQKSNKCHLQKFSNSRVPEEDFDRNDYLLDKKYYAIKDDYIRKRQKKQDRGIQLDKNISNYSLTSTEVLKNNPNIKNTKNVMSTQTSKTDFDDVSIPGADLQTPTCTASKPEKKDIDTQTFSSEKLIEDPEKNDLFKITFPQEEDPKQTNIPLENYFNNAEMEKTRRTIPHLEKEKEVPYEFPDNLAKLNKFLENLSRCNCKDSNFTETLDKPVKVKIRPESKNSEKTNSQIVINKLPKNEAIRITISPKNITSQKSRKNKNLNYIIGFSSLKKALNEIVNYDFQYTCSECKNESIFKANSINSDINYTCPKCKTNAIINFPRDKNKDQNLCKPVTVLVNKIHGNNLPFKKLDKRSKRNLKRRPQNSNKIPLINNKAPHPQQLAAAFERESIGQSGELERILWALARMSTFDDGSKTFEIVEATPIPPGHYSLPGTKELLIIGSKK